MFPRKPFSRLGYRTWIAVGALSAAAVTSCIVREAEVSDAADEDTTPTSAALPAPVSVLGNGGLRAFEPQGAVERIKVEVVPVEGQPFKEALQAEVLEASDTDWSVQVLTKTQRDVKSGETLLGSFMARVTKEQESGGGESQFVFELARAPWSKAVTYSFRLTTEWRKIQVPFTATQDFAAGDAQIIFRLGYDPETIQLAELSVDSYGEDVPSVLLPNTKAQDLRLANLVAAAPKLEPIPGGPLNIAIDPKSVVGPISRFVYGINSQKIADTGTTVRRNGGNRGTVYNWELNASNAGRDYRHQNDDWPCTTMGYTDCERPGAQFTNFVRENAKAGADTIVTVPVLDWVSADKKGPVEDDQGAPSARFLRSEPKKPTPFSDTPDLHDDVVYQDEFVHMLVKRFGKAAQGGPKFYSLDNEPALWPETHPRIHKEHPTYDEVVRRHVATASAIADVDETANILGGVMFGWSEFQSLSSAPDSVEYNKTYGNYVEFYLDQLRKASESQGRRLIHSLDIHWYPESRGTKRITEDDASAKTIDARLQAPRSFWDESYVERSWITQNDKKPVRLLRWFKDMIGERFPGTYLSMTEYNFGGTTHVSGGLAQVDVLGIFGREGVFMANYWGKGAGVGDLPMYVASAFRLYRNYDGKGGKFGDVAVVAQSPDQNLLSVFAATDSKAPGRLTIVVINKHLQHIYDGSFSVGADAKYSQAKTFVLDGDGPAIEPGPTSAVAGGQFQLKLQPAVRDAHRLRVDAESAADRTELKRYTRAMRLSKGSALRRNRWLALAPFVLAACAGDSGSDQSASSATTSPPDETSPTSDGAGGDAGETSESDDDASSPEPDAEPAGTPTPEPDEEPEPSPTPDGAAGTSIAPQENGGTGGEGRGGASATGGSAPNGNGGEVAVGGGSGGPMPAVGGGGSGGMSSGELGIAIDGTTLRVNGEAFHIQGIAWNPVGPGQTHPAGLDYAGYADVDIPLMQAVGINVVRTYEPLLDRAVLDQLYEAGIYVLNSIYPYGGDDVNVVTARVSEVQDHPAILMWLLGNEWNYNGLYVDLPHDEALARLKEAAGLVRAQDAEHPIATVYGELPDISVIERMPEIDVWGINAYRGISFGGLFDDWQERSQKPMFLAEYGADAYNANIDSVDLESQAEAVVALVGEIANASSATGSGPCVGGAWFEWADEWWKDQGGSPDAQDVGGIAPGGGPHPDATFNEEWWGVVDLERNPRPAYEALGDMFLGR